MKTIQILTEYCTIFRNAIEKSLPVLPEFMASYPVGCCGNTCLLLGHFLSEKKLGIFYYTFGENGSVSHAWLSRNTLYIDITANQFSNTKKKVVVNYKNRLKWYEKFNPKVLNIADYDSYDGRTKMELGTIYKIIISNINIS